MSLIFIYSVLILDYVINKFISPIVYILTSHLTKFQVSATPAKELKSVHQLHEDISPDFRYINDTDVYLLHIQIHYSKANYTEDKIICRVVRFYIFFKFLLYRK